ncbi:transposase [Gluconacetobacter asukensis]|uniref:Mutator family transposase n=1 Tax=Gluconacetobacter asukensis TaxID=1017181 RepID=A0A7W4J162_9PROT|nr:transposase [Gluconacetobacter asukensis]MBB2172732.1 IS256 family transposase [Gluconacetobacter asukensis]
MPAPNLENATDSAALPIPADQFPTATDAAAQAAMNAASLVASAGGETIHPAIWGRAYERTLMSAPDRTNPAAGMPGTDTQGQTDRMTPDMTHSWALASDMDKALIDRLLNTGLKEGPGTPILNGQSTDHTGNRPQTTADQTAADTLPDLTNVLDPTSTAPNAQPFPGVDERIAAMYAPPPGSRDIHDHTPEIDENAPTPEQTARMTGPLRDALTAWQRRRLNALYPAIFFDTLRVKIRDDSIICDKPVHIVLGMRLDGTTDLLGLWIERHEGAALGRHIMDSLKRRGVEDILMAVVDEPDGFPDAVRTAFPQARVHPSIDHLLHHLPDFMALKDRAALAGKTAFAAESPWGRMLLATTHAIKALNAMLGRAVQARGYFPNDEAALAFLYLKADTAEQTSP